MRILPNVIAENVRVAGIHLPASQMLTLTHAHTHIHTGSGERERERMSSLSVHSLYLAGCRPKSLRTIVIGHNELHLLQVR